MTQYKPLVLNKILAVGIKSQVSKPILFIYSFIFRGG